MKKILIIGATGSLAQYVIEALQNVSDISVTLFVRNKKRLSKKMLSDFKVIEGDALIYNDVKNAVTGHDIVYVNLSGDLEKMAKNIVYAMKETGVQRIIAVSSIGIYDIPLKPVLIPYRRLADVIEASELDYTILRPDWFTNGIEIDYAVTYKGQPETGSAVSRKSIAAFIVLIVKDPSLYIKQNVGISKP